MANVLKIEHVKDFKGDRIWVTDKSGVYDAANNAGGYGAPNFTRGEVALLLYVRRVPSSGDNVKMDHYGTEIVYNALLGDDYETEWEVSIPKGGRYLISMILLLEDKSTLSTGDYYYDSVNGVVKEVGASTDTEVTDYEVLVDEDNANKPLQSVCDVLLFMDLEVRQDKLYREYKNKVVKKECQAEAAELFDRWQKFYADIQSANTNHYKGTQMVAAKEIEGLIEETEDIV